MDERNEKRIIIFDKQIFVNIAEKCTDVAEDSHLTTHEGTCDA